MGGDHRAGGSCLETDSSLDAKHSHVQQKFATPNPFRLNTQRVTSRFEAMPLKPVTAAQAYPRFFAVVQRIPRGRVASYAQVANAAGLPGRARMVGRALGDATASPTLPWHRVINAQGRIALPKSSAAYAEQKSRLVAEGVSFDGERVSFARYGWTRSAAPVLD